jgi:hypothetical protein
VSERSIEGFLLVAGAGNATKKRACIMSAVSWIAGEPWSDHPACASPVLTSFAIRLNDSDWWRSDAERTSVLAPLAARLVGTRGDGKDKERARRCREWAWSACVPAAFEAAARQMAKSGSTTMRAHGVALAAHVGPLRDGTGDRVKAKESALAACFAASTSTSAAAAHADAAALQATHAALVQAAAAAAAAAAEAASHAATVASFSSSYANRIKTQRRMRDITVAFFESLIVCEKARAR